MKHSLKNDTSRPLREVQPVTRPPSGPAREAARNEGPRPKGPGVRGVDPVVQRQFGINQPSPLLNFDGSTAADNTPIFGFTVAPPDTEGDVGAGMFFQFVNSTFQIWNTAGVHQLGPLSGNDLFTGFGGFCENQFVTDPIVRYDELSARWLATFLAFDINVQDEFHMCLAVSTSSDPTGAYNRYDFDFGVVADYPKFGVWPDGYYMTINQFSLPGFSYIGIATWAFDRDAMIAGLPATAVGFDIGDSFPDMFSLMPADLDGAIAPPVGAPNHQVTIGHPVWDGSPLPVLHWFDFHVDFATPANSTLTGPLDLSVPDFNPDLCGFSRACIPQLESGDGLDPLPGRPMHGLQYRNMGTHESMVFSSTVNVSETGDEAGVRWYEIRTVLPAQGGVIPFSLFQSGTYAPSPTNRFMPSMAMDINGNIAMGYSVSDATIHPEIGITGRLAGDPLGQMGSEDIMFAGAGSQIGTVNRWGDYSSMGVDPADGCTFWYTNEYYDENSEFNWRTRIGSFKFASCTAGPSGTLTGTVTDGTNPLEGATVTADLASTLTNAAGQYTFTLPVGDYDMTASKYGYLPGSADDVPVTQDNTTTQDFVLAVAPTQLVNGVVRDGSGGNWPLYARIQVSGPGYPGSTFWTDPVTGYYEVTLVEGITYNFAITAVSPGYEPGGGAVDLGGGLNAPFLVRNWTLTVNASACNAPGYTPDVSGLFEDFNAGGLPAGWTVTNDSTGGNGIYPTEWVVVSGSDPCGNYTGNLTGGDGGFAVANSDCPGSTVVLDSSLITPSVDLSGSSSALIRFNSDFRWLFDNADVDVSIDGGTVWTNVLAQTSDARGPRLVEIDITALAAGEADVKARFHNYNAAWAWWWQVDNVLVGEAGCLAGTGGLVVGTVNDDSTDTGLNGATVQNIGGGSTTTFATPDPEEGDGFYILYAEAGNETFEASATNFEPQQKSTLVIPNGATRLDFSLLSGNLTAAPSPLSARVDPGGTDTETLTLTNTGGAAATFEIIEINAPLLPNLTQGFANQALKQQALARLPHNAKGPVAAAGRSTQGLAPIPNPRVADRVLANGDVLASYDSNIAYGWGVATSGANLWLSNLGVAGGDDLDYEYTSDGVLTGDTIDDSSQIDAWAADGAFNPNTGKFWRVDVVNAGDSCIFELDPVTNSVTGNRICPPGVGSQRGLAYDVSTDTYYAGSWLDGVIYHFDTDGNIIDSAFVGLSTSGLAYNPANGHLLVMQNIPGGDDITVLDALNNYDVLGSYPILDDGVPAITAFGGAGAEFDCIGNLWVIDQNSQVIYLVETGEGASCEVDIPWFSADPTEGTVAANGGTQDVIGTFDAGTLLPGLRLAQIQVKNNTPHTVDPIPVTMVVRFLDVPDDNQFEAFIYGAAGAGIMMGGPPNCPAGILNFCPDNVVTRADMAGYIWRAVMGANTPPPVYQNIFGDVTFNDYNSFYIQGIFDLGITAGCGNGNYCPNAPNTRAQMSVFIWKGEHGGDAVPPACTPPGSFADVLCPGAFAADYIYALFDEGVTAGCGGGNFCPDANITNGQMSVFLVRAFNIPHL